MNTNVIIGNWKGNWKDLLSEEEIVNKKRFEKLKKILSEKINI